MIAEDGPDAGRLAPLPRSGLTVGYRDDMYDRVENGQIIEDPPGYPVVIDNPDWIGIDGGHWKPVAYEPAERADIIAEVFEELRKGVERPPGSDGPTIWLYPHLMYESLDLIKDAGSILDPPTRAGAGA